MGCGLGLYIWVVRSGVSGWELEVLLGCGLGL